MSIVEKLHADKQDILLNTTSRPFPPFSAIKPSSLDDLS